MLIMRFSVTCDCGCGQVIDRPLNQILTTQLLTKVEEGPFVEFHFVDHDHLNQWRNTHPVQQPGNPVLTGASPTPIFVPTMAEV